MGVRYPIKNIALCKQINDYVAGMDREIEKLAELLRQNGHKISNGSCKFTLTSNLLNHLNSAFNLILERREAFSSSFHVLSNTEETNAKYRDLYFLYDFVQLVKSLKLTKNLNLEASQDYVDISKFKGLELLEIRKINVNTILGIASMRMRLLYLICERSITKLSDLLESCGADESEGHTWYELKGAILTHNNLREVDNSLRYVPWLNTLDLSNNLIENADGISCLLNLKYLNLSFNKLMKVPSFNGQICRRLQVLDLHNNFIDNIYDVSRLVNLQQLNLIDNCLIEHDSLIPLSYLPALLLLNLKGNPLSYHPQHRIRSVRYLHRTTASVKFVLDDLGLNKAEYQSIHSLHPKPLSVDQPSGSNSNDTGGDVLERSIKVREAVIADDILECLDSSLTITKVDVRPAENVDNREQMASLRKDYIKILYDKTGVNPREYAKESPKDVFIDTHQQPMSSTPLGESIINSIHNTLKEENTTTNTENNTTADYVTASDTTNNVEEGGEQENEVFKPEVHEETKIEAKELSDDEELESGESNIFSANIKATGNDVIVILTETHITEKDPIRMKSLGRFTLDSLSVCDMITENDIQYVHLEFDTVKINSSRFYYVEEEDERNRLHDKLKHILESRPPKEISNLFTCMKCSTQFGLEDQKTLHKEETVCPVCGSNLVFQEDQ